MLDGLNLSFYMTLLGGSLLLVLSILALARLKVFTVKAPRNAAFCDLIDYATKAERNIYMLKSGALLSIYEITLPDMSTLTTEKMESIYRQAQLALLKCEPNYCLQFDALRTEDSSYVPFLRNNNPVLSDIEQRKAALFKAEGSFVTKLYLSITYMGEAEKIHLLQRSLVDTKKDEEFDLFLKTNEVVKRFRANCAVVTDALGLSFEIRPLSVYDVKLPELVNTMLDSANSANPTHNECVKEPHNYPIFTPPCSFDKSYDKAILENLDPLTATHAMYGSERDARGFAADFNVKNERPPRDTNTGFTAIYHRSLREGIPQEGPSVDSFQDFVKRGQYHHKHYAKREIVTGREAGFNALATVLAISSPPKGVKGPKSTPELVNAPKSI